LKNVIDSDNTSCQLQFYYFKHWVMKLIESDDFK